MQDAWLVSGCLFQTVWNVLADERPMRAIKDYDVFYFDGTDLSADAEQRVNQRAAVLFAELGCEVDVRNQARVHMWYEGEFGVAGYPLATQGDGRDRQLSGRLLHGRRQKDSCGKRGSVCAIRS